MQAEKYDPVAQALHWLTAIAVLSAYAIGLWREDMPRNELRAYLLSLHMSLGLLVLFLTMTRLVWKLVATTPTPLTSNPSLKLAAKLGHLALYAATLAIPLIGLTAAWAKARNVTFFDLFVAPSPVQPAPRMVKGLEEAHEIAAHAMLALAGLHALAAIFHQWVLKDGTLARMAPFAPAKR